MKKDEKKAVVDEVEEKLKKTTAAVLTDYRGLKVHELGELRRELRSQGVEYKVYKNTLVKKAVDKAELSELDEYLTGPTAIAFSYDDPVAAAKLIAAFSRKNKALSVKGGLLEGRVIDAAAVRSIANLPSREILLSKLVGMLQAPVAGFANVVNAPIRGLAAALGQIAEEKGKEAV